MTPLILAGVIGLVIIWLLVAATIAACILSSWISYQERQHDDQTQRRLEEYVEREDENSNLWEEALAELEQSEARRWGK